MTLAYPLVRRHCTDDQDADPAAHKREDTDHARVVHGEFVLRHRKRQYFDRSDPLTGLHHLTITDGGDCLRRIVISLDECVDVDADDSGVAGVDVGTTVMGRSNLYAAAHSMSGDVGGSMVFVDFVGIGDHDINEGDVLVDESGDIIRREAVAFGDDTLAGMITDVGAGNMADSRSGRTCYILHSAS
jgi:hypothetical protein